MDEKIYQIAEQIVQLHQKAYEIYLPLVEDMCNRIVSEDNCYICLIIYWTLLMMRKYWDCIKGCVEDICMYILVTLSFTLKHIGKCKRKIVIQQNFLKRKENKVFRTL